MNQSQDQARTIPDPNCEVNNWNWTKNKTKKTPDPSDHSSIHHNQTTLHTPHTSLALSFSPLYPSTALFSILIIPKQKENKTEKSKQTSNSALSTAPRIHNFSFASPRSSLNPHSWLCVERIGSIPMLWEENSKN